MLNYSWSVNAQLGLSFGWEKCKRADSCEKAEIKFSTIDVHWPKNVNQNEKAGNTKRWSVVSSFGPYRGRSTKLHEPTLTELNEISCDARGSSPPRILIYCGTRIMVSGRGPRRLRFGLLGAVRKPRMLRTMASLAMIRGSVRLKRFANVCDRSKSAAANRPST